MNKAFCFLIYFFINNVCFGFYIQSSSGTNVCYGQSTTLTLMQSNGVFYPNNSVTWYYSAPNNDSECSADGPIITFGPYYTLTVTSTITIWAKPACGVSNGPGSLVSITLNASNYPLASINNGNTSAICQGSSVLLLANTGSGLSYQWKNNGTNISGATSSSYTANAAGSYTVVVTNSNGCSATSSATTVTVSSLPTATITSGGSTTICQGSSVVLNANTGTGLTYQWKNNGTNISGATSSSHSANAAGSYTVVVTNSNGCSATSAAKTVSINTLPLATVNSTGATTFCQGNSVVLNANTGSGLTYQWKNNGTNITGATSSSYTANAAGSYSVVVTNSSGCSATSTATSVTINSLPTATITAVGATTFCQGNSVVLNANTGSALIYQWKNNGTNISGATSSSYTANAAGSYTVVITNSNGCSATSTATTVTISSLPTATITSGGSTTICQGNSVVLYANTGSGLTYQWKNNGTNITGATSSSYTANAAGSYSVVVTNSIGCSATSTATSATINSLPTASITAVGATTFCQGNSVVLYANTGSALIYQWKNNGTIISGATSSSYTANAAGSYSVVVTNSNGCSATSTATTVTISSLPTATITSGGSTSICQGSTVVLNANTGTGLTYQWKNNGTNISGATTASYSATTAGSYTVVVTNSNICSATSTVTTVTVNTNVIPTFTEVAPVCSGGSLSTLPTTSINNISGTWTPEVNNTITTTYTFTPTLGQCATSKTMTITVNPLPVAILNAGGVTTFCQGDSVILNANEGIGLTYQWQYNGTNILGAIVPSFTATTSGSYNVVVTNNGDCSATSSISSVTVNSLPIASITPSSSTTFCQGSSVLLNANTDLGLTYQWQNNGLNIISESAVSYTATTSGNYAVLVTNSNGCSVTSTTTTVLVNPNITPTFSQILPICSGGSFALPSISNENIIGTWSPLIDNTQTTSYIFSPISNQCATNQSMTVVVNSLPNVLLNNFPPLCDTIGLYPLSGGSPSGGVYSGTSVNNSVFNTIVGIGSYSITYTFTDINGCSSNDFKQIVVIDCNVLDLENSNIENQIILYPNPTSNIINVKTYEDYLNKFFEIYDISGKVLIKGYIRDLITEINIGFLSEGVYYFKLAEFNLTLKFVKAE
jgi:hypothetical protein